MGHHYLLIYTGLLALYVQSSMQQRPLHFILYRGSAPHEFEDDEASTLSSMSIEEIESDTTTITDDFSDDMSIEPFSITSSLRAYDSSMDLEAQLGKFDTPPPTPANSVNLTPETGDMSIEPFTTTSFLRAYDSSMDLEAQLGPLLRAMWSESAYTTALEDNSYSPAQDAWLDFLHDRDYPGDIHVSRHFFYTCPSTPQDIHVVPNSLKYFGLPRFFTQVHNAFAPTLSYRHGFLAWPEVLFDYGWVPIVPFYSNDEIPLTEYSMPGMALMKDWAFADIDDDREDLNRESLKRARTSRFDFCRVAWYPDFITPEYAIAVCDKNNVDGSSTAIENWHARVFTFDEIHELSREQYLHGKYTPPRVHEQLKPVFPTAYFTGYIVIVPIVLPGKGIAFVNDVTGALAFYQVQTQTFVMVEPKTPVGPFGHLRSNFIVIDRLLYWITDESEPLSRMVYQLDTPTSAETSYRWRLVHDHPFTNNMEEVPLMELPAHLIDPVVASETQKLEQAKLKLEQAKLKPRASGKKRAPRGKICEHKGCNKKSVGITECTKCDGIFCPLHATTHRCGQKVDKQVELVSITPKKIDHV